jgi:putative intracellular protease/amidase
MKVLFITTSHDAIGDVAGKTGLWLEEMAAPYYIFKDEGIEVTVASPKGGEVPLDPKSQSIIVATYNTKRFQKDPDAMDLLARSLTLAEVKAADFDAVFLTGGHGALWDLSGNEQLKLLLEEFSGQNKPIAAVSHSVTGLLNVKSSNGELLLKGKLITAFSSTEEESAGMTKIVPFLIESALNTIGAIYSKEPNYVPHVVTDHGIITGQNPASSMEVGSIILAMLRRTKSVEVADNPVSESII